jgi:hypothetical protein
MQKKITWTLWLFIALIGISFFSNHLYKKSIPFSWKSAEGAIIKSETKKTTIHLPKGANLFVYRLQAEYSYSINGQAYISSDISYPNHKLSDGLTYDLAVTRLKKYSKGSAVTVYYNPSVPTQSVLIKEIQFFDWFILVGFLLSFIVSIFRLYKKIE